MANVAATPLPSPDDVISTPTARQSYVIIRKLGGGISGQVYEARGAIDGKRYALKLLTLDPDSPIETPADLQAAFDHETNLLVKVALTGTPHVIRCV
jgi:serine/threonine protein kinase